MYEQGARVEEIAAYIGDLESTTRKYYMPVSVFYQNVQREGVLIA